MALFKFRWPSQKQESEQTPVRRSRMAQAESVDDMRRRARHRLIGAAVLVVLGVIGFPILFDTQPRPIPVDVPIEIPDRNQVAPLMVPGTQTQSEPAAAPTAPASPVVADGALGDGEELVLNEPAPLAIPKPPEPPRLAPEPAATPAPAPKPEVKAEPKLEPKPKVEPKPEVKPEPKPEPKPKAEAKPAVSDAERARALLEGRAPTPAAAVTAAPVKAEANKQGRFIVQVGAFADVAKANEVRSKLERAGLKTYTQAVDTKDGKRTRVRVGPFDQRDDADKAASRIKGLGLPASVLTL